MLSIYKKLVTALFVLITGNSLLAQVTGDTTPVSLNPQLQEIYNSKFPKEYTLAGITVTGTQAFPFRAWLWAIKYRFPVRMPSAKPYRTCGSKA
jgi:hypothetical protein